MTTVTKENKTSLKTLWIVKLFIYFSYFLSVCGLMYYTNTIIVKFVFIPNVDIHETWRQSSEIPFPAVTICSPVVIRSELASFSQYFTHFAVSKKPLQISQSEQNFLAAKTHVCGSVVAKAVLKGVGNRTEFDTIKLLVEGAPTTSETFPVCMNDYVGTSCTTMLTRRSLTNLGICYTFNLQDYDSIFKKAINKDFEIYKNKNENIKEIWTLEKGFSSDNKTLIPYPAHKSRNFQFYMMVNDSDKDDLCYLHKGSFQAFIHLPSESPNYMHTEDFINLNKHIDVRLTAVVKSADKTMKKYSALKRGCYFQGERKLQFFKTYTKAQCNFECLTNYTIKKCNCVHFSYPRDEITKICDLNTMQCQIDAYNSWPEKSSDLPCNCLPSCNDIEYAFKSRKVSELVESSDVMLQYIKKSGVGNCTFASYNIQFGDFQLIEYEHFISYTLANFIADCGGLLGLFLGFSLPAVIDIFSKSLKRLLLKLKKKTMKLIIVKPAPHESPMNFYIENEIHNVADINHLRNWQRNARLRMKNQNFRRVYE